MELRAGISLAAIEQWGYQTVHGTNPVTYDLPIPFEEAPFTVAISTGNSGNHASCGGFTKTTIVLRAGTTAGVWDTVGFFIIGCQLQWGIVYAEQGYIIVTLPLAYSSNKYVVIGQDLDYTSNDTDGYGENVGVTQVTTTSIRVSITRGRYLSYCTIGF